MSRARGESSSAKEFDIIAQDEIRDLGLLRRHFYRIFCVIFKTVAMALGEGEISSFMFVVVLIAFL